MKKRLLNLTTDQLEAIKFISELPLNSKVKGVIHGNTINSLLRKGIVQKHKNKIDYVLTKRGKIIATGNC